MLSILEYFLFLLPVSVIFPGFDIYIGVKDMEGLVGNYKTSLLSLALSAVSEECLGEKKNHAG